MKRILLIASILFVPAIVGAHSDHDTDSIKARKAYFTLVASNIGGLGAMAKGKIPYDAGQAASYADNLVALIQYDGMAHFPAGSSIAEHKGETRAMPDIWEDATGFEQKWAEFANAVNALAVEAGQGKSQMTSTLSVLSGTCKGCHDSFRAKDF